MTSAENEIETQQDISRRRLYGLSWSHFLNDGSAGYLPGILPAVLISLHAPVQMASVLMGILVIGQALQPLMGWIADRAGGRLLIALGLLGSSVGGALLGFANHLWIFIGLLCLIGIGNALFHPQALASIRILAKTQHGLNTSLFLIGGELGRGIWPTAAGFIVEHFGLPGLWVFILPVIITVPFIFIWAPRMPANQTPGSPIRWHEHSLPLVMLVGFAGFRSFMTYGTLTLIPLYWSFRGGQLTSGASIITTLLVIGVIGNVGGGHLADRVGRRPVMLLSVLSAAVLVPAVAFGHGAWIWIFAALLGIALFLSGSTTILLGQDIFPENRSLGSGIALGFANGIGALLIFVIGFWVNTNNIGIVFWLVGASGVVSALFVPLLPKHLAHHKG